MSRRSSYLLVASAMLIAVVGASAGATPGGGGGTKTSASQVSFTSTVAAVGESGGTVTLILTRTGNVAPTTTVVYETHNGTAGSGSDYAGTGGLTSTSFGTGEKVKPISITILPDTDEEPNETFALHLHSVSNSDLSGATLKKNGNLATVTIADDDPAGSLAINDPDPVIESTNSLVFTVTLTLGGLQKAPVSVAYTTSNDSASAPGDYTAASGTLTWNVGDSANKTKSIALVNDNSQELTESFHVNLSSPVNATISDNMGTGIILDDDGAPALSVNDPSVAENAGPLVFDITLSPVSQNTVAVAYTTAGGSATEGSTCTAGKDFTDASGTVSFSPGQTVKQVSVPLCNDGVDEPNEDLSMTLSLPSNATIADPAGVGTILDDEATPDFSIADATTSENVGSIDFVFTISGPSSGPITANLDLINGTASGSNGCGPGDFNDPAGLPDASATIPAGSTQVTVSPVICNDSNVEGTETFTASVYSTTGAVNVLDGSALATIYDDDVVPDLTVSDGSANEDDGTMDFTVALSEESGNTININFDFAGGTAVASDPCEGGVDYVDPTGFPDATAVFLPGETTKTVTVTLCPDSDPEPDETFNVNVTSPPATVNNLDGTGEGTIVNDDAALPTLSIDDVVQQDIQDGPSYAANTAVFTVTLSAISGSTVTVDYATADGTATSDVLDPDQDYDATSGTLTFDPGDTTKTISVQLLDSGTQCESNENFFVNLTNESGATVSDAQGEGTITDIPEDCI